MKTSLWSFSLYTFPAQQWAHRGDLYTYSELAFSYCSAKLLTIFYNIVFCSQCHTKGTITFINDISINCIFTAYPTPQFMGEAISPEVLFVLLIFSLDFQVILFWLQVQNSWIKNLACETTLKIIPEKKKKLFRTIRSVRRDSGFQT